MGSDEGIVTRIYDEYGLRNTDVKRAAERIGEVTGEVFASHYGDERGDYYLSADWPRREITVESNEREDEDGKYFLKPEHAEYPSVPSGRNSVSKKSCGSSAETRGRANLLTDELTSQAGREVHFMIYADVDTATSRSQSIVAPDTGEIEKYYTEQTQTAAQDEAQLADSEAQAQSEAEAEAEAYAEAEAMMMAEDE